jgi:hypothetical protein
MISFLMLRNDRPLARAAVRDGVLSAIVGWVSERPGHPSELHCSLGGLETSEPQDEHLHWVELADLTPGDVITIRIEEGQHPDEPTRRSPGHQHRREPDGYKSPQCSFCGEFRRGSGVAGADVVMCARCLALSAELLDRNVEAVFHLRAESGGHCSFCLRPQRSKTVGAGHHSICDECVAAVSR